MPQCSWGRDTTVQLFTFPQPLVQGELLSYLHSSSSGRCDHQDLIEAISAPLDQIHFVGLMPFRLVNKFVADDSSMRNDGRRMKGSTRIQGERLLRYPVQGSLCPRGYHKTFTLRAKVRYLRVVHIARNDNLSGPAGMRCA